MPTGLGSRPTFSCSHPRSSRYISFARQWRIRQTYSRAFIFSSSQPRAHSPEREEEPMSAFDGFVNFHPSFVHAPVVLIPTAAVMVSGIKPSPENAVLEVKARDGAA